MGIKWTEYRVGRRWSFSQSLSLVEPRAHDNVNLSFRCDSKLEAVVSISILLESTKILFLVGTPLSGTDYDHVYIHRRKRPSWVMVLRSWSWAIVRLAKAEFLWVALVMERKCWEMVGKWLQISSIEGSHPFMKRGGAFLLKGKGLKGRGFFKIHVPELYVCTSLT